MGKTIPHFQLFLILVFLSLFLVVLDNFRVLEWPKRWAFFITNTVSFSIYRINQVVARQFYFITASRSAAQENKALKDQLAQLLSENAGLKRKLSETEAEVMQEHHLDPKVYNMVAARPVGFTRFLKIDKGTDGGLKLGQAVVYKDNYVGKIVEISNSSANVQVLSDPQSKIAAFSRGLEGNSKGVAIGQFATEILMDKILHEEKIQVGDLVYSEGTEGFLPRGLILGKVSGVIDAQNEIFKKAKIKPVFEISDMELVFVIIE